MRFRKQPLIADGPAIDEIDEPIAEYLAGPPPAPAIAAPPIIKEKPQSRAADAPMTMPQKLGMTAALAFGAAIGMALWYAGARWTLDALRTLGWVPASGWSGAEWLIPLGVTTAVICFWPKARNGRRPRGWLVGLWTALVLADLCTSGLGAWIWGSGRPLPMGGTLPESGLLLALLALLAALLVGFGPEKLLRAIVAEFREIWEV